MGHRLIRSATGTAIAVLIAGAAVANASGSGTQPPGDDSDVPSTALVNDESTPQDTSSTDGASTEPIRDESTPQLAGGDGFDAADVGFRPEDAPEFAASIEGVADAGNGFADPALDVGGVDGSIGADQDG